MNKTKKEIEALHDKIRKMNFHETIYCEGFFRVTRVMGGWIYTFKEEVDKYDPNYESNVPHAVATSSVFVPDTKVEIQMCEVKP